VLSCHSPWWFECRGWLQSNTTETAVVGKPATEEDHGHGHHGQAH
jgi:hypothetical protein